MKLLSNLKGDLFGGLTASIVSLPLAIAFGVAAFAPLGPDFVAMGALAGLYAAIIGGAMASIFGGTPAQISGPTAPMSVVVTSVIVRLMKDPELTALGADPSEVILLMVAVTILFGGLFQIGLGLVGGGKLIKYIPYPVVSGFMNGIAVIIFTAQLRPLFGAAKSTHLTALFSGQIPMCCETVIVGLVTVAATVLGGRYIRALPGALFGLAAGMGAFFLIGQWTSPHLLILEANPLIIGPIPSAIPTPSQVLTFFRLVGVISPAKWGLILVPAATLGVLAAIDTLLTSVVADVVTRTKHNSNRELVGQGIGNAVSALFGGLPVAGSTVVTMLNVNSGGRTPLSGIAKSLVVLLVMLILGSYVQWIPMSVLAGILIVTAVKMVDYQSINLFRKKSAMENLVVILAVTVITVSVDLMIAVGIGLVISSFLFVKEQISKTIVRRKYTGDRVHSKKVRSRDEMAVLTEHGHRICVYELSGSLFFGTCDKLQSEIEQDLESLCIILDFKRVTTIDLTGAHLIRQIVDRVQDNGNHLLLSYFDMPGDQDKERMRVFMEDLGIPDIVGKDRIFHDTDHALEWAEDRLVETVLTDARHRKELLALRDLTVFQNLDVDQLETVNRYLTPLTFAAEEVVFKEGEVGNGIYFILSGHVSVITDKVASAAGYRRLASFSKGVFFGDMSILEDQPRSATVRCNTDARLLFMPKTDFQDLTEKEPLLATRMLMGIARELSHRLRLTTVEVRALAE
ncbi:MAG: SLC26A/SulP transporter family protein [Desulfobacterales bacterium]|nr:SLC26A/SulP transporter family protein [Desulfobacterales bacterium]